MTATKIFTRILLVSFLIVVFIAPGFLFSGNSISHEIEEQSVIADTGPLSIIFMIGDGMGYEHVELARLVEFGENGSLFMEESMWNASMTTHSANADVTDSAAAGTALATGNKTNNGMVGVLPDGTELENIIEFGQSLGKATGIVSTSYIVDATPGAFSSHVDSRYSRAIIAQYQVDSDIDVILGGGEGYFTASQKNTMVSKGYSIVYDRTAMNAVTSGKIFGLFAEDSMQYEQDRNPVNEPSIAEMTNKSIELLSQDPDGFFLMVEGGRIDHAAHEKNQVNNALETIAFDKAVKIALDYVKENNNTILIVTADHETEGLVVQSHNLNSTLPASHSTEAEKMALRIARANNVTVDWTADYHTDWPVPVYTYGTVFSELTTDVTIDNTIFFGMMKDYFLNNPLDATDKIAPSWSVTPSNQEITVGASFSYQVTAVDTSDIGGYAVNNTVDFAISSTGLITNMTSLVVGSYGLNVSVWDVPGNTAFREITITVLAETTTTTTTTTTDTTSETTSTTDTTNTTTTSGTGDPTGIPLDPMMLTIAAVGAAFVVIVVLVLVKKR